MKENEQEEWKDIPGLHYQVSSLGRVRSTVIVRGISPDGVLEPNIQNGYPVVTMRGDTRHNTHYVHRLVAAAFLGPCPPGYIVHHRDGNRANAQLGNLEYISRGCHIRRHFIEECAGLEPGRPGGGISIFDSSKGYTRG